MNACRNRPPALNNRPDIKPAFDWGNFTSPYQSISGLVSRQIKSGDPQVAKFAYRPDVGRGCLTVLEPFKGTTVVLHDGEYNNIEPFCSVVSSRTTESLVMFRLVHQGTFHHRSGRHRFKMNPGAAAAYRLPFNESVSIIPKTGISHRYASIAFSKDGLETLTQLLGIPYPKAFDSISNATALEDCLLDIGNTPFLRNFSQSLHMQTDTAFPQHAYMKSKLLEFLCLISNSTPIQAQFRGLSPREKRLVIHARDIIDSPNGAQLSVIQLSGMVGLNRNKLCRGFTELYSCSIGEYLRLYRLETAIRLMTDTDASLTSIAHDCGFAHLSSFTRSFTRQYGVSPQQYRKECR